MTETLTIPQALIVTIQKKQFNIIIENDSQIAIQAIIKKIKSLNLILNITNDIVKLACLVRNTKFVIHRRYADSLAGRIV